MNLPVGALEVDHVTKTFRLYEEQYRTIKERALHLGRIPFHEFDAVHDVNFEVRPSKMVGILGHNGSGKSTLLKCIAGTMQPTAGSIRLNGRMAALLELGAGFHPELTGRENLFLAASIMGYTKHALSAVFDEIVAFAELEQFMDIQVKHYSSGMFARLGFALAVNVEPEILLIDEILAVGDEAFQQKCLDRFRIMREQGVTMLFVTHNTDLASTICDELIVLDRGRVIANGDPVEAATTYRRHLYGDDPPSEPTGRIPRGTGVAHFDHFRLLVNGRTTSTVRRDDTVTITFGVSLDEPIDDLVVAYAFRDPAGHLINSSNTNLLDVDLSGIVGNTTIAFTFEGLPLVNGMYEIELGAHSRNGSFLYTQIDSAFKFAVVGQSHQAGAAHLLVRGTAS